MLGTVRNIHPRIALLNELDERAAKRDRTIDFDIAEAVRRIVRCYKLEPRQVTQAAHLQGHPIDRCESTVAGMIVRGSLVLTKRGRLRLPKELMLKAA